MHPCPPAPVASYARRRPPQTYRNADDRPNPVATTANKHGATPRATPPASMTTEGKLPAAMSECRHRQKGSVFIGTMPLLSISSAHLQKRQTMCCLSTFIAAFTDETYTGGKCLPRRVPSRHSMRMGGLHPYAGANIHLVGGAAVTLLRTLARPMCRTCCLTRASDGPHPPWADRA